MKKNLLTIAACGIVLVMSAACENSSNRSSASESERTEHSDTTYMESMDENGQPTTDGTGGTVTETQGTIESGYGAGSSTESDPHRPGSMSSDTTSVTDDRD